MKFTLYLIIAIMSVIVLGCSLKNIESEQNISQPIIIINDSDVNIDNNSDVKYNYALNYLSVGLNNHESNGLLSSRFLINGSENTEFISYFDLELKNLVKNVTSINNTYDVYWSITGQYVSFKFNFISNNLTNYQKNEILSQTRNYFEGKWFVEKTELSMIGRFY